MSNDGDYERQLLEGDTPFVTFMRHQNVMMRRFRWLVAAWIVFLLVKHGESVHEMGFSADNPAVKILIGVAFFLGWCLGSLVAILLDFLIAVVLKRFGRVYYGDRLTSLAALGLFVYGAIWLTRDYGWWIWAGFLLGLFGLAPLTERIHTRRNMFKDGGTSRS